jgi:Asparaginase
VITCSFMSEVDEQVYRVDFGRALDVGYGVLEVGGGSFDVVIVVVRILEDSLLFNVVRGAVFNYEGVNEFDVLIMDGKML